MLVERAEFRVKAGQETAFAEMMAAKAVPILKAQPGVGRVSVGRGVEAPSKFMLLVEWGSLDDHKAFNQTPGMNDFRALFGPYTEGGAMEHFEMD